MMKKTNKKSLAALNGTVLGKKHKDFEYNKKLKKIVKSAREYSELSADVKALTKAEQEINLFEAAMKEFKEKK